MINSQYFEGNTKGYFVFTFVNYLLYEGYEINSFFRAITYTNVGANIEGLFFTPKRNHSMRLMGWIINSYLSKFHKVGSNINYFHHIQRALLYEGYGINSNFIRELLTQKLEETWSIFCYMQKNYSPFEGYVINCRFVHE